MIVKIAGTVFLDIASTSYIKKNEKHMIMST